ncbi:MAG: deoxyribose-phosphate aldolase [Eubacteriales bacterium]|nr:deoxyribose-phosphate aldolase [Eubacteriales bacterium]
MEAKQFAKLFDHTCLKADATQKDMEKLCAEAREYGFAMVAINPAQVRRCRALLQGSDVHVGAAIGFPLGQTTLACKVFETRDAIENGADEIDYVVNLTELKEGNLAYVEDEMRQIVTICREHGVISKVIFENCCLTDAEKETLCRIAVMIRPDFVKTSTGFGAYGARVEDVALMKRMVGDAVAVKAAGGVRDLDTCLKMYEAGATRIGTSAAVRICEEFAKR